MKQYDERVKQCFEFYLTWKLINKKIKKHYGNSGKSVTDLPLFLIEYFPAYLRTF